MIAQGAGPRKGQPQLVPLDQVLGVNQGSTTRMPPGTKCPAMQVIARPRFSRVRT